MVSANFNIEMVAKLTQEERKDQLQFKLTDFDRKPIAIGVLENARCGRECILYRRGIVIEVIYQGTITRILVTFAHSNMNVEFAAQTQYTFAPRFKSSCMANRRHNGIILWTKQLISIFN